MPRSAAVCLCLLSSLAIKPFLGQSRPAQSGGQLTVTEIVRQTSAAVVQIVVSDESGKEFALGSGFIVSADGKIVTNFHVIEGAHSAVAKLANGSYFPIAGVLAADADRDLVLLQVEESGLPFLTLGSTAGLQVGDQVVAIGSPLGLEGTVSDGIVSAIRNEAQGKHWIQTTAPVSHGNSGGPLLDMRGKVVGVISAGVDPGEGQNLNFAIPSDEVKLLFSMQGELSTIESVTQSHREESATTEAAPPEQTNPKQGADDQEQSTAKVEEQARFCESDFDTLEQVANYYVRVQHTAPAKTYLDSIAAHNQVCTNIINLDSMEEEARERNEEADTLDAYRQQIASAPFVPPLQGLFDVDFLPADYYSIILPGTGLNLNCGLTSSPMDGTSTRHLMACSGSIEEYFSVKSDGRWYLLQSGKTGYIAQGEYAGRITNHGTKICLAKAGCHHILAEVRPILR